MYKVIIGFTDGENGRAWGATQGGHRYEPGDTYPQDGFRPAAEHTEYLLSDRNRFKCPVIGEVVEQDEQDEDTGAKVKLPCPHCGKWYATEATLAAHIASKHPEAAEQDEQVEDTGAEAVQA